MKVIKGIIEIIRPLNSSMTGIAIWIGWSVQNHELYPSDPIYLILLCFSGFLFTSCANTTNDILDKKIDRYVHPKRPILTRSIDLKSAYFVSVLSILLSFFLCSLISFITKRYILIGVWSFSFILLILYESFLKKLGFLGNINISFMTTLPFALGALITGTSILIFIIMMMAFFTNLGREIFKDIDDMKGDFKYRKSLPLIIGPKLSNIIAYFSIIAGIIISFIPPLLNGLNFIYIISIVIADMTFVLSIILSFVELGNNDLLRPKSISKFAMVISLFGFLSLGFY